MIKHIHFLLTYACNYECDHCCFTVRRHLVDRFPDQLAPRQVYGLDG